MYLVNKTLQFKEKGNARTVLAGDEPQELPVAIAKEAVKRGYAVKVDAKSQAEEEKGLDDSDNDKD
jgi:hypothetical protein